MRPELAAGAGDGRRARDGAGLRRGLGAAPGLNLSVTGHGRYRDASGHLADDGRPLYARAPAARENLSVWCWSWC